MLRNINVIFFLPQICLIDVGNNLIFLNFCVTHCCTSERRNDNIFISFFAAYIAIRAVERYSQKCIRDINYTQSVQLVFNYKRNRITFNFKTSIMITIFNLTFISLHRHFTPW